MPVRSSFLILVLLASAGWAAELTTLKGDLVKGDVVGISDKEVVLAHEGMRVNRPLAEVLKINFRDAGKIAGTERIAVMAALNIAHEFLGSKAGAAAAGGFDSAGIQRRISAMHSAIDRAMAEQDKLL